MLLKEQDVLSGRLLRNRIRSKQVQGRMQRAVTKSCSGKTRSRRNPPASGERLLRAAVGLNRRGSDLLGAYQSQICELEGTITHLRERLGIAGAKVEELRESCSYFLELFEQNPAGHVVHSAAGVIFDYNNAAAVLLGLPFRTSSGASLVQYVAKRDVPVWLNHIRRCQLSRQTTSTELSVLAQKGRVLPVQILTVPKPTPHGEEPARFHSIITDISQRRATEAALVQTQQDYRRLIDTVEGIVWEADARTLDVVFVSQYAERLLGYRAADWRRPGFWTAHIYVDDRERVANQVARAVARREDLRIEYRVQSASRQRLWLHDSITLAERDGRLMLLGVAVDVTERRRAEERLLQANDLLDHRVTERTAELRDSIQELEAFSYSISHDLRSPLRAMRGYAELALAEGGEQLSPVGKDYLQRVISSAHRADRLVQDVLAYSRASRASVQLAPVNVEKLVRDLIDQSPQFQPPQAQIQIHSPLLPLLAHEALLAQCLTNLLSNAVKFVAPNTTPQIGIRTERFGNCARLWVEDNGIGVKPADLGRIFNIFERVQCSEQFEGTGIGLAIVRKGAERMGGSVGVESELGKGSRFWIQLKGI